ncbi:MAG: Ig-like domain-containing protein, partial [Acidobacteriaceae bacterium]|nr:Ig-like domain-containing protein [Acidobacteriaceae bacterium]
NSTASCTTSALGASAAAHVITANYLGGNNYNTASGQVSQKVDQATPGENGMGAVILTSNPSLISPYGKPVTFTAQVPTGATGYVAFLNNGAPIADCGANGTVALTGTTATCTTSTLPLGPNQITAKYLGDANFSTASATVPLVVMSTATATSLTVTPSTVTYGTVNSPTLLAQVLGGATGTVTFTTQVNGATIVMGTQPVAYDPVSGFSSATMAVPTTLNLLPVGTYSIVANYNGDPAGNFAASSSTAQMLTVTPVTGSGGTAGLTITVNNATQATTDPTPVFSYTVTGLISSPPPGDTSLMGHAKYVVQGGQIYLAENDGSTPCTTARSANCSVTSPNYTIAFEPGTLTVVSSTSTTTLTVSPTAAQQYGSTLTLTTSVVDKSSNPIAGGTVYFYDGIMGLGVGTVSNGVAALTLDGNMAPFLSAGTHSLTAVYNGDSADPYASSRSNLVTVTVNKRSAPDGGAALTVTVSNQSHTFGTGKTPFMYQVTAAVGVLPSGVDANSLVTGVPVYATSQNGNLSDYSTAPAGSTFDIVLMESSNPTQACSTNDVNCSITSANYTVAYQSGKLTIAPTSSTTTLSSNTSIQLYGKPVTLTAQVTPAPTGMQETVEFYNGAITNVIGTGAVDASGKATLTTTILPVGSSVIGATYMGDVNYGSSSSVPVVVTVIPVDLPTTPIHYPMLTAVPNQPVATQPVILTAAFPVDATGTVTFTDQSGHPLTNCANVSIMNGVATCMTTPPAGTTSIGGSYSGGNYNPALLQPAIPVGTPSLPTSYPKLDASPNPPVATQSVTLTANLPTDATGTVKFTDQSDNPLPGCASVPVTNGVAICMTVPPIGTTSIGGNYSNGNYNQAPLQPIIAVKTPSMPPSIYPQLLTSPNPPVATQPVTLTAEFPTDATGTVVFTDQNGTALPNCSNVSVVNGVATCTTTPPAGTTTIGGNYANGNYSPAPLPAVKVVEPTPPATSDFTLTVAPPDQTVVAGATATYKVTVTPADNATSCPVSLTLPFADKELPSNAIWSFSQSSLTPAAGGTSANLTIIVPAQTPVAELGTSGFGTKAPLALAALLLPLAAWRRRKNWGKLLMLLVLGLAGSAVITGCGAGGHFSQPSKTYTVTITGTSACSGGVTNSTISKTVTLTVGD